MYHVRRKEKGDKAGIQSQRNGYLLELFSYIKPILVCMGPGVYGSVLMGPGVYGSVWGQVCMGLY